MNRLHLLQLAWPLLLMGCAQLSIDVDIYRGPIPVSTETAQKSIAAVVAGTSEQAVAEVKGSVFDEVGQVVRSHYRRAFPNATVAARNAEDAWTGKPDQPGTGLKARLDSAWRPVESAAQRVHKVADETLRASGSTVSGSAQLWNARMIETIRSETARLDEAWKTFKAEAQTALSLVLDDPKSLQELNIALSQREFVVSGIAASDTVTGRFAGSPVFDARVSALSQSPEDWSRFGSNHFEARGGTSQFVVVREGLLVYHQKALDFDPTPAVGAGAAVTRLGLKVGAALVTGVAVSGAPASPGSTNPSTTTLFDADAAEVDRELLERTRRAREQLLSSLATLLDQSEQPGAALPKLKSQLKGELNFFLGRTANLEGTKK